MTMFSETYEIGPMMNAAAPDFVLQDHEKCEQNLRSLMGTKGLLLGFIKDIWLPASIRRILYMQRHTHKFTNEGCNMALIIVDKQYTLYSFYMSSPMTVVVPLLADPHANTHQMYNMIHSGLVLLDNNSTVRAKWLMPDERVWPKVSELLTEVRAL